MWRSKKHGMRRNERLANLHLVVTNIEGWLHISKKKKWSLHLISFRSSRCFHCSLLNMKQKHLYVWMFYSCLAWCSTGGAKSQSRAEETKHTWCSAWRCMYPSLFHWLGQQDLQLLIIHLSCILWTQIAWSSSILTIEWWHVFVGHLEMFNLGSPVPVNPLVSDKLILMLRHISSLL